MLVSVVRDDWVGSPCSGSFTSQFSAFWNSSRSARSVFIRRSANVLLVSFNRFLLWILAPSTSKFNAYHNRKHTSVGINLPLVIPYIFAYKSIFWVVKREFPEAPRLIHASYFLPTEENIFSAILDTQHYSIQPYKSQGRNKIITSLPTKPLLFNE